MRRPASNLPPAARHAWSSARNERYSVTAAAVILDCEGLSLTPEEKRLFARTQPYGYILFARNCETPSQVRALTQEIKNLAGQEVPILIDQEGGRVARLRPPHWRRNPAAGALAALGGE